MNIHRTKKIGFLSTIIVHCAIIILCIFSSIKYHKIETPSGVEIEILAYSDPVDELNQMEDSFNRIKNPHVLSCLNVFSFYPRRS